MDADPHDLDGPWKDGHPDIPAAWKGIGSGGNANVWFDGRHAVKRLKPNTGVEAKERFAREARLQQQLSAETQLPIVPVVEVRERRGGLEIVMDRMTGNLDEIIGQFRGNAVSAADALMPIVECLLYLSKREPAVFHRDIKPTNIFYRESAASLILGDFGCAHISNEERLTPVRRAVGSWAYRAPEISGHSKLEIDDKIDVFSLGKTFWSMINGEKGITFPASIWHLAEYDLTRIFPEMRNGIDSMLLVGRCCAVSPRDRPNLEDVLDALKLISNVSTIRSGGNPEAVRAEAYLEVQYQQRSAMTSLFVKKLYNDLFKSIDQLRSDEPGVQVWSLCVTSADLKADLGHLVEMVAVKESDAPILILRFRQMLIHARFYPKTNSEGARFEVHVNSETIGLLSCQFTVYSAGSNETFRRRICQDEITSGPYSKDVLLSYLDEAYQRIATGMAV